MTLLAGAVLVGLIAAEAAHAKTEYLDKHPSTRLVGCQLVSFQDGVVRLQADRASKGILVLKSDEPLVVSSVAGGQACLKPGWDGTLGYSHYGLEVSTPGPGEMVVTLQSVPPPQKATTATPEQVDGFRKKLSERTSRFPDDKDGFAKWQRKYRAKLASLLMGGGVPQRVALEARILDTKEFPAFTLRRVEYRTQPDRTNTLLLSLPRNAAKAPLLLALHGHEATWGQADEKAYTAGHADDFCSYFAERGWAVLQPATMNHTLQHSGWTLQGEWTWDAMVALDYAATVREVDMARAAVCGLSTGAHLAMNVLALDDRVKAGVVGCVLSTWNHYERRFRVPPHCDCGIRLQLQPHLEQCDWAALAAPRPVQFQHGRRDAAMCPGADEKLLDLKWNIGIMPPTEYDAMFAEVQRAWRVTGAHNRVETRMHDGPHRVNNAAAFAWLQTFVGQPASKTEVDPGKPHASILVDTASDQAAIRTLGWDTEGGSRSRINLLRSPATLCLQKQGRQLTPNIQCERPNAATTRHRLAITPTAELIWEIAVGADGLSFTFSCKGRLAAEVERMQLVFPLDSRTAATTVLVNNWTADGGFRLPVILSAPDLGQMLVTCRQHPNLDGTLDGNRKTKDLTLQLAIPCPAGNSEVTLDFRPIVLPAPPGLKDPTRWVDARRGWFNFIQLSARRPAKDQGDKSPATPAGLWANNVLSDPVSSTTFWLGDATVLMPELSPGVSMTPILRRTIDYWMDERTTDEGRVWYVVVAPHEMMDANPAVLIGAWCYVEASKDVEWLKRRIARLEFLSSFMEKRDVDGDGLVESTQSGNRGTHAFGDTAWDTYSSGHKNAYVNALAYRAWRGLADLEGRLGRNAEQERYRKLADRLRNVYVKTFLNPQTGWLGWWRSEDGFLHDVHSDVPTSLAITYGLVDKDDGRMMLQRYWKALGDSGFRRFDLGVPLNIKPVHRDDQCRDWGGKKEDGSDTFGKYLNGGCCVSNTLFFLTALYRVGMDKQADTILDAMLRRQREGVFPNGGGFQNGIVDRYPHGAEFFDWQGNTCGYEGHLVYSWCFLQAVLLREPSFAERLYGPLQ